MDRLRVNRRQVITSVSTAAASWLLWGLKPIGLGAAEASAKLHLATNVYPWTTFYRRDKRDFNASLDDGLAEVAQSGMDGFEPIINSPQEVDRFASLLDKHGLEMRSFYVNSALHDKDQADASVRDIVQIAQRARDQLKTKFVVTNPSPIQWGGTANKNDAQLRTQAAALNRLGEQLQAIGMTLAYHNHDMELHCAAREFHHMMLGTDPALVTLCLDAHWIYRGSENSVLALFDIVKLYASRVSEVHIRQSVNHVSTEAFCDGDIDYAALIQQLVEQGVDPHLVLEQAVEQQTPKTMDAAEAHRKSGAYARRILTPIIT